MDHLRRLGNGISILIPADENCFTGRECPQPDCEGYFKIELGTGPGGPYVCEQCRLDGFGGNDRTLTMQAVTTIELAAADVCADCGARLLEGREVKERA